MKSVFEHSLDSSEEYETQLAAQDQAYDRRHSILERAIANTTAGFKSAARRMSYAGLARKIKDLSMVTGANVDHNSSDVGENQESMSLTEVSRSPYTSTPIDHDVTKADPPEIVVPTPILQPSTARFATRIAVSGKYPEPLDGERPSFIDIRKNSLAPRLPEIIREKSLREELGCFRHRGRGSCSCLSIPEHSTGDYSQEGFLRVEEMEEQVDTGKAKEDEEQSRQQVAILMERTAADVLASLGSSNRSKPNRRGRAHRCVLTPFHKV